MVKIISVTQQKGGAGKTTLTANLGAYFSHLGHKVLLIDTDPQGSLSMWFEIRQNNLPNNTIEIVKCKPESNITEQISKQKQEFDFVFVDTPPHASTNSSRIIRASDYVIIPAQLTPPDIWASQPILDMAQEANIHHVLVLNRVPAQGKISSELHSSLAENELPIAKTTLGNRNSFVTSFLYGKGVTESEPRSRASEEIKDLCSELMINMVSGKTPKAVVT